MRRRGGVEGDQAWGDLIPYGMTSCTVGDCLDPTVARSMCKRHWRAWSQGKPLDSVFPRDRDGQRMCRRCRQWFPLDEFPVHPQGRGDSGRYRLCGPCKAEYGRDAARRSYRKTRAERPEKVADIRRRQRERAARIHHGEAGLGVHQRREAGHPCDICGERTARMAIDHCHAGGQVRGLLCARCNLVLGQVGDDTRLLGLMVTYLIEHATVTA